MDKPHTLVYSDSKINFSFVEGKKYDEGYFYQSAA